MIKKGFTLIEVLIVIALLVILALVVLSAVNPVEQLKRAKDASRKTYANELLRAIERFQVTQARNPQINPLVNSLSCEEIINGEPVEDISELRFELSSWFGKRILNQENRLYVGLLVNSGVAKICHQVESVASISRVWRSGCSSALHFFLCVPD